MAAQGRVDAKIALITGAASGIGRATAYRFAAEGARVAVIDVDRDGGEETVDSIRARRGSALFVEADVSRCDDVRAATERVVAEYGALDILVNNAGIEFTGTIEQTTVEDWDRILRNNLTSVFLCSKLALPHLRARGGGAIVNIASVNGLLGIPEHAAYNSGKGGVISLTRQLAVDYGPSGIRVNCICPGTTDTPMAQRSLPAGDREAYFREVGKGYPLRRIGQPQEVANAVLFLASDEASWITGVVLPVDGGYACQ